MQTEHLFELTYILLDKKTVTAAQMAEHFGVSQRTIYRWVDALNLAGVPVITTKGKGGGISLAEKYTLDKAVLTEDEKLEILSRKIEDCSPCSLFVWTFQTCKIVK